MLLYRINKLVKSDKSSGRRKHGLSNQEKLDVNVREFVSCLELSDEEILNKFKLSLDGNNLTPDQARRFIAFVRNERGQQSVNGE